MQYQVPQFIELEPKLVGPLTVRQSIYVLIGAIIIFLIYLFFDLNFYVFLAISLVIALLAMISAFLKYNNKSFGQILSSMIIFVLKPRIFIWKQERQKAAPFKLAKEKIEFIIPKTQRANKSMSALKQLTRKIDLGT